MNFIETRDKHEEGWGIYKYIFLIIILQLLFIVVILAVHRFFFTNTYSTIVEEISSMRVVQIYKPKEEGKKKKEGKKQSPVSQKNKFLEFSESENIYIVPISEEN